MMPDISHECSIQNNCRVFSVNLNKYSYNEGDTPSPLAYCVPAYFGLTYCVPPFFGLAYCVPFNNKNNYFGRLHLHKEDKITLRCMHMYNHS